METKYSRAIVFKKETDLLPYWEGKRRHALDRMEQVWWNERRHLYAQKRNVQLILQLRYLPDGTNMARIKCPINPLPTKGEFPVCHLGALIAFLQKEGWNMEGSYGVAMFM